jgi:hypothetical protein
MRVDEAPVRVVPPETLGDLVRIRARSRLGGWELAKSHPEIVARERSGKHYARAWRPVVARPWLWPHAAVYLFVNLRARRLARRRMRDRVNYVWDRDESSRRAGTV